MLDFKTLHRDENGRFSIVDVSTVGATEIREVQELTALFDEGYDCPEAYFMAGIKGYAPMLAKEIEDEEHQDKAYNDLLNIIEEKFDGTRGLLYFMSQPSYDVDVDTGEILGEHEVGYCRLFSRNLSIKTNFYNENSDRLPHIRELDFPELEGTILDGELFIDGLPFKEVSSTMNCLWHEAVDRQIKKGFVTFHAFDILKYRGIDLRKLPLAKRKGYLKIVVEEVNSPYIKEVPYYSCGSSIGKRLMEVLYNYVDPVHEDPFFDLLKDERERYPELFHCYNNGKELTPKAFYELVVLTGGEGVIIKSLEGKYLHKRGKEYSKIKAFVTRDLVVIGFEDPTKEYKGKNPKNWAYFEDGVAVTKHYYNKQVGNLVLGVLVTPDELKKIPENKRGKLYQPSSIGVATNTEYVMEVCVCSGFDDETREYFTRNRESMVGRVIEVKANGVFKDSGALRHPRFFRLRTDKASSQCVWSDHIGS